MNQYYLAIDIGASSGRHILGYIQDGRIQTKEIHRFQNEMIDINGKLCWDVERLFNEIKFGLKRCKELNQIPISVGIDTWGVDFVLLDKEDQRLGDVYAYRDLRTNGMDEKVCQYISEASLYQRTGIQKQIFNTIYQLMAVKEYQWNVLAQAETLLMIPDYFHFLLTGKKAVEYTNATTTQLVSPTTKQWDTELIELLGYPQRIFPQLVKSGTVLGEFTAELATELGFSCKVVLPATHDTGSAVLAVPSNEEDTLYLSSGTWSLMGVERQQADTSSISRSLNFTNEGGYQERFRYLKNIMGLWMIQCLQKELKEKYTFAELCKLAEEVTITSKVDCNSEVFLAPDSMINAIQCFCKETGQAVPESAAELAHVIYESLAECYAKTIQELEVQMNCTYKTLHIVGGGANARYLNQLTARAAGLTVLAGPTEATAIGNLLVQMITDGKWDSLMEARRWVRKSFQIETYECIGESAKAGR